MMNKSFSLSDESKANLMFASKISIGLSFVCAFGVAYTIYVTIRDIRDLNETFGSWSWLHYLTIVRALFAPVLAVFAWICWHCSKTLRDIAISDNEFTDVDWNTHASNATWLWISLSLFAVVSFFEMAARYSMTYFGGF